MRQISAAQARRIALEAQGFNDPKPAGRVTAAHLRRVMRRIGMLQLDSVNVLVRSHYLPWFSRLGPYPRELLDNYAYKRRELFEYWGHAASLIPMEHYPLFQHRMDAPRRWGLAFAEERPEYIDAVLQEVTDDGPLAAGGLSAGGQNEGPWWGWGPGKTAMEYLWIRGFVATAGRPGFTRVYDLAERVIKPQYYEMPPPSVEDAQRELVLLSARSLGVGTARDIADYYRLPVKTAATFLNKMADDGAVEEVRVEGWKDRAYLHPETRMPRKVNARALLSMFDSLVWERARTERLFGFRYRIEIYTPEPKRVYGYYVLPFLLGDTLVGRVDLKADRQGSALLVRASHVEAGVEPAAVALDLAEEIRSIAEWLGLGRVVVEERGGMAGALREAIARK